MKGRIFIVTGGINSGKTTKMAGMYRLYPNCDGFISRKIFTAPDCWVGYEIVRLSSQERMPLAYKAECVPAGFDEMYRMGPFCFSGSAFGFAETMMAEMLAGEKEPLFIDEIGPLELQGKGFAALLTKMLNTGKELVITVRSSCVTRVIEQFNIQKVVQIEV